MKITTIGDGAMATVCSQILANKSTPQSPLSVSLWGRDPARLAQMNLSHENPRYLPNIPLSHNLLFDPDPISAFSGTSLILCAVPTQYIRPTLTQLKPHIPPNIPILSVSKGIEISTLHRPSEIIREILGLRPVAALSGPNIATELAQKLPATMVVATQSPQPNSPSTLLPDEPLARQIQQLFTTRYLRVYRNDDLLGVELAGALKNVIAIAAGILDGMHAGNNAKAALLTRGLVEITRLGIALGAQPETFSGLAGLGDLVTTCFSPQGRNRSFGQRIGQGETTANVLNSIVGVVEGMPTCKAVVTLAREKNIEMPLSEGLHAVLYENQNPATQLADLMSRESKHETSD